MEAQVILQECYLRFTRSTGKGGQHMNKVSTKVEIYFNISTSGGLTEDEKSLLLLKLQKRVSESGFIKLYADDTRSQSKNRELVEKKLIKLLQTSLVKPKRRKPTRPGKAVKEKRLESKKKRSDLKQSRKRPN